MRNTIFFNVWLLSALLLGPNVWGQRLAFELPTVEGELIAVGVDEAKATVVVFLGTECPMARAYASELTRLNDVFSDRSVTIVGVMSNFQDSAEDVARYIEETSAGFQIVLDDKQAVADAYGATRTPEAFLLDSELRTRYRGRIDDRYAPGVTKAEVKHPDLRDALVQLLDNKPVTVKQTRALGCIIGRAPKAPTQEPLDGSKAIELTFHDDVFPMLQKHCVDCHRPGEIGPFSMTNYQEVLGWAETMLETIEDERMPPWHAAPTVGQFSNARHMPEADKQILADWLAAGAPEGQSKESATLQESSVSGWQLDAEPDVILDMRDRPFTVPATGVVEYQYFVVDPKFTEDRWIQGAQVIPGARDVVHHAIVFVRPPDGVDFQGVGWLTAYVPGQRVLKLADNQARLIPAGSKLVFQMHYTPNGTVRDDITKVGLVFANPEFVEERVYTMMAINQDFEIPPGDPNFKVSAELGFVPKGSKLLAITPHMHFRGKSFYLEAGVEDDAQPLLSVPSYDFNWQHTYINANPLKLDSVKALRFEAAFDNSDANPFNPDPTQTVTWGDQTWEEMAVAFFEVAVPNRKLGEEAFRRLASDSTAKSTSQTRAQKIEAYVSRVMEKMDRNGDGQVKKAEAPMVVRRWSFWRWDQNNDQIATEDEIRAVAESLF